MSSSESGDFNHIQEAIAALHDGAKKGIKNATKQVRNGAAGWAPVDTGFLKASHYYVTSDESTYTQAMASAHGKDEFREVLPEVEKPSDDLTGIAAVAALYGLYVEMGTRSMAAQPFMTPAADAVRGKLAGIMALAIAQEFAAKLGGK